MYLESKYTQEARDFLSNVQRCEPAEYEKYQKEVSSYIFGIMALMHRIDLDTDASEAAAQVLLGTYNTHEWHLSICDLCLLDGEGRQAALNVIKGRLNVQIEPHKMIENGADYFRNLGAKYDYLRIENRK